MAAPALPTHRSLKALVVYRNIIRSELMRSVHVYRWDDGYEEDEEREYIFHRDKNYEETYMGRIFTANYFDLYEHYERRRNGVWVCILMFDVDTNPYPDLDAIPRILSITRNPKLESIPSLANDLHEVFELGWALDRVNPLRDPLQEATDEGNNLAPSQDLSDGENDRSHQQALHHLTGLDLNSVPPASDNEGTDQNGSGRCTLERRSNSYVRLLLSEINFLILQQMPSSGKKAGSSMAVADF